MKEATICFPLKNGEVLLAMKKRGFGEGLWNGMGGKFDLGKGDVVILDTAVRELEEEIKINSNKEDLKKVALIHFKFPNDPAKEGWNQDVHVYLCEKWEGKPRESEEMKPKWFKLDEIPYDQMWDGDKEWIPLVLSGKIIEAIIGFDENNKVISCEIEELSL